MAPIAALWKALLVDILLQTLPTDGRVFLGVSKLIGGQRRDFDLVGRFCYVIPKGERGVLYSNVVIKEPGHKLVLTRTRDSEDIFSRRLSQFSKHGHAPVNISRVMMERQMRAIREYQKKLDGGAWHRRLLSSLEFDSLLNDDAPLYDDMEESMLESNEATDKVVLLREAAQTGEGSSSNATAPTAARKASAAVEGSSVRQHMAAHETADPTERPAVGVPRAETQTVAGVPRVHAASRAADAPMTRHPAIMQHLGAADVPPPVVVRADVDSGSISADSICEALEARSRVAENLMPVAERSAYNLVLWVENHVSGEPVDLWITRCGGEPHAEYHIEAVNPGSIWVRHFGCEELGVLQTSCMSLMCYAVCLPLLNQLFRGCLRNRREHPVIDCYFLACGAAIAHALCHCLHIVAFAFDGLGVRGFAFLGDMAHAAFVPCVTFVIIRLVLGRRLGIKRARSRGLDASAGRTPATATELMPAAPWIVPAPVGAGWSEMVAAGFASLQRLVALILRYSFSWNGVWLGMSVTAAGALWLQGVRSLTSPDALVVPDFEFLHPSHGRSILDMMLGGLVRLHWILRLVLGLLCLRSMTVRRLDGPKGFAGITAVLWCVLIPLNVLVFQHYHHVYQFAVPMLVAMSNISVLIGLGALLGTNTKYCQQIGWSLPFSALPLFSSGKAEGGGWEGVSTKDTDGEPEPQLIDLSRLPQPGHEFSTMK